MRQHIPGFVLALSLVSAGAMLFSPRVIAGDDVKRVPMTAAALNFFTPRDTDDKKTGSRIVCELRNPASSPIVVYAENTSDTSGHAFPDDSTSVQDHGFPGGVPMTLTSNRLLLQDWKTASLLCRFSGVDNDTWITDLHIKLTFADGTVLKRLMNHVLFNTTGQATRAWDLGSLGADSWNDSGRW